MHCVRVNFQPFEGSCPIKYGFAGKRGRGKAGVAYANGQQSDNRSNAGFLDPLLGKAATRPGSSIEARSMSHGAAEPAPLGSTLSGLEKNFSNRGMQVILNVGFLGAGFAILSSLALESTTDPWHAYQKAVTFHPIETKVSKLQAQVHLKVQGFVDFVYQKINLAILVHRHAYRALYIVLEI